MHVAETREELQLLADQTGPFVELLDSLGAWFPETCPRGATALDILQLLSRAPRSLVIHGNYLDDAEIDFVARHSDTMSVVYCPRTHEFFEHETWPLEKFLGAGINVAIGTDSRASNPDLNLFEELKCLQRKFPDLEPEQILAMGTREGAVALGLPSAVASIAPGNRADFNIVEPIGGDSLLNENSVCIPLSLRMDGASGKGSSEPVAF